MRQCIGRWQRGLQMSRRFHYNGKHNGKLLAHPPWWRGTGRIILFSQGPVFLYYALDNFFQNHRKYVKSRDDDQLMGKFKPAVVAADGTYSGPSSDCAPYLMYQPSQNGAPGVAFAPCGAIARSLFNGNYRHRKLVC